MSLMRVAICCLLLAGCGGVVASKTSIGSLTASTQQISFGDIVLNTSSTQSIVLTSTGTAPVTITGFTVSGAGFKVSGLHSPTTLSPGQRVILSVQFLPILAGTAMGSLTLTTNSFTSPSVQVDLTGVGGLQSQTQTYNIGLTWSAPSPSKSSIAGYEVYRSSSANSQFLLLNASINEETAFTDTDVESGVTYQYYVTTVDLQGNQSVPSNVTQVTVP